MPVILGLPEHSSSPPCRIDTPRRRLDQSDFAICLLSPPLFLSPLALTSPPSRNLPLTPQISGLGAEVAKNVILAGVRSVTLHDERPSCMEDLSSQFCLGEEAARAGVPRARASVDHLRELNPYVDVRLLEVIDVECNCSYCMLLYCIV